MNSEMYDVILNAIRERIFPADSAEELFCHELATIAASAAEQYTSDLLEAVGHLQETVKRLSHVDTGTAVS